MADPNNMPADLMRALMQIRVPDNIRQPIHQASYDRGNGPFGVEKHIGGHHGTLVDDSKVWVVDRILEPQMVPHFMEYMCVGSLPSGNRTSHPLLSVEEVNNFVAPYSTWAPEGSRFRSLPFSPGDQVGAHIGSFEDDARLQVISKDLHAMKSLIWEGMAPVSERRWREKRLDEVGNFNVACQLMSWVVNVFHYLNQENVKRDLRETYNLIYGKLETYEAALNMLREREGKEKVSVTGMWAEFIGDHYGVMVNSAYNWVTEHVERLRGPVLERLGSYQPAERRNHDWTQPFPLDTAEFVGPYDRAQWDLTNQLHDLAEIRAHTDHTIFLPMDGYRGFPAPPVLGTAWTRPSEEGDEAQATGMYPLVYTSDTQKRRQRYVTRLKVLSRQRLVENMAQENALLFAMTGVRNVMDLPANSPARLRTLSEGQVRGQHQAGLELRGEKVVYEQESWVRQFQEGHSWGFVVYRVSMGTDEEFEQFKSKFETDAANWGSELKGVEEIKRRPMFHWIDARSQWSDGGIEGLRKHFDTLSESDDFPDKFQDSIFLVADEHTVQSYINPLPESVPPGDNGGSILAVDAVFTPADLQDEEESPGFNGQLRILTSLLWDELSVFLSRDTYRLIEMWPVAMKHPWGVYTGPVTTVQDGNWRLLLHLKLETIKGYRTWKQQRGTTGGSGTTQ